MLPGKNRPFDSVAVDTLDSGLEFQDFMDD